MAFDKHMENIQKDVKYEPKHIKATKHYGGDTWYESINDQCYENESLESNLKKNRLTIKEVEQKIRDLYETIEISPGLDDNYILWKGGDSRGIDLTPGAKNKWAAYSSTSVDRDIGEDYYEDAKERIEKQKLNKNHLENDNNNNDEIIPLLFKIRAKSGTKGVYMDKEMQENRGEYEFLLGRMQEFKIIDSYPNPDNPEMIICEIELL